MFSKSNKNLSNPVFKIKQNSIISNFHRMPTNLNLMDESVNVGSSK